MKNRWPFSVRGAYATDGAYISAGRKLVAFLPTIRRKFYTISCKRRYIKATRRQVFSRTERSSNRTRVMKLEY